MSPLAELRALSPRVPVTLAEAARVAERQAHRLLRLQGVTEPPVPEQLIECLPRIEVAFRKGLPTSGAIRWTGGRYLILVNAREAWVRQRFSLAHEFKHAVDLPLAGRLYAHRSRLSPRLQADRAADAFAAALLMPKSFLKRAFYDEGLRDPDRLARRFQVSRAAMRWRIDELGLLEPAEVAA